MSAASKLERLHEDQLREGRWPTFPGDDVVLDVLPEIIAVVKAAEKAWDARDIVVDQDFYEALEWLRGSLNALDRKLEEK